MFLPVFSQKVEKRSQKLKCHKKEINECENKIIRFYYKTYFSALFNTSYYIIMMTPIRFECISFAFLCLFHLVYRKITKNISLYHHQYNLFAFFILLLYFLAHYKGKSVITSFSIFFCLLKD